MVRLNITLSAASPAADAENLLKGLSSRCRAEVEEGSISCSAWSGGGSLGPFDVEDWATEENFRRRVLSDRFTVLLSVVESATDAEVQFDFVNQTRGLNYVLELREQVSRR